MSAFVTAEPFPPGEYLQDELTARDWKQEDLSSVTGISRRQIANILKGVSGITPESAKAIAAAFGQEASTWMNLQVSFELAKAAVEERDVEKRAVMFNMLPIRAMQKRRWLPTKCSTEELENAVCNFLNIRDIAESPTLSVAARKSDPYEFNNPAQLAWYFRVRSLSKTLQVSCDYDDSNWDAGTKELLSLSQKPEDVRKVPRVLSDMGIRLVLLQHLPKSKIDGVAMWVDDLPVIGLSLRYDRLDNFWFSLMHEMIHIKHRHESPVDENIGPSDGLPEIEKIANDEAANLLIPDVKIDSFVKRCGPSFTLSRVVQFARAQQVHPHIVVGQLRHRKLLEYWQHTKLQEKVSSHIRGQTVTEGWGDSINLGS